MTKYNLRTIHNQRQVKMTILLNNQKLQLKNVHIYSTDTVQIVKFEYSMTQLAPVNRFIIQEELVS